MADIEVSRRELETPTADKTENAGKISTEFRKEMMEQDWPLNQVTSILTPFDLSS